MPALPVPFAPDVDYVVIDEHPAYRRGFGEDAPIRKSRSAIAVYAPILSDDTVFLCRTCMEFWSKTVSGIHSHQKAHKEKPVKAVEQRVGTRIIVAFGLLPDKIQKQLLARADQILKEES